MIYRYQLARYSPFLSGVGKRVFGVILQDEQGTACRFNEGFETGDEKNFRAWLDYFKGEIDVPDDVPATFCPPRNSIHFLEYLQSRTIGNYSLTAPFNEGSDADRATVLNSLFATYVVGISEAPDA